MCGKPCVHYDNEYDFFFILEINAVQKELPVMMEMFFIPAMQYSSHSPHVTSVIEKMYFKVNEKYFKLLQVAV